MQLLEPIILGAVQGITEFLPISSSGHLIFIPKLLGWSEQGMDFDVAVHVATLLAIIWVLRTDIADLIKTCKTKKENSLLAKIIIATIPVGILGVALSVFDIDLIRSPEAIATGLIVWGIALWAADRFASSKKTTENIETLTWTKAIAIGCMQMLALIPGTSRSGITITGGLLAGLSRTAAARFSFLLAIPAIAGAGLVTFLDVITTGLETPLPIIIAGFISAFFAGTLAIRFLLAMVAKISYGWFSLYRIAVAIIILIII